MSAATSVVADIRRRFFPASETKGMYMLSIGMKTLSIIYEGNKFTFIPEQFPFSQKNFIKYHGVEEVDAILADLGVSSHHFDADRGIFFPFRR